MWWALIAIGCISVFRSEVQATIRVWESNDIKFENVWQDYLTLNTAEELTIVRVGVYINTIYSVNEQNMDFTVNLLLRMNWKDKRLAVPENYSSLSTMRAVHPEMASRLWNQIWLPDITFRNEIRSFFHVVPVPNKLLIIRADGTVHFVPKLTLSLICRMDLRKFPMDTQRCPMFMESYGHTTETLVMEWLENADSVEFDPHFELSQYRKIGHERHNCTKGYQTGYYPCLRVDIILKRNVYYYLVQIYLPATLVVILSWLGFWINCSSEPARVSLSLLSVLTMSTQRASVNTSLPPVSYVKAIDIWMMTSLVFVFLSLVEYAIVSVLARGGFGHKSKSARRRKRNKRRCCFTPSDSAVNGSTDMVVTIENDGMLTTHTRDSSLHASQCPLAKAENSALSCWEHCTIKQLLCGRRKRRTSPSNRSKGQQAHLYTPNAARRIIARHRSDLLLDTPSNRCDKNAQLSEKERCLCRALFVDRVSRIMFPASFLLFNVVYWCHYFRDLNVDDHSYDD